MPRYAFRTPNGRMETIEAPTWDTGVLIYNERHGTQLPFDPGNIPPGFQPLTQQGQHPPAASAQGAAADSSNENTRADTTQ
jgi:hypothetical protein